MEVINAVTISEFFLSKRGLTPKKIQKLVYYAYAWFIALNNQSSDNIENTLFNEQPEAWIHGPVFPSLYRQYKSSGWNEVQQTKEPIQDNNGKKTLIRANKELVNNSIEVKNEVNKNDYIKIIIESMDNNTYQKFEEVLDDLKDVLDISDI